MNEINSMSSAMPMIAAMSLALSLAASYQAAESYSAANKGISMLVMLDGKIVFEDYPNGGGKTRAHELASGTKSFSSALAILACMDGFLNLDEKVSDTVTEWKSDPSRASITVHDLLSLTSGLPGGTLGDVPSYADAIKTEPTAALGQRFQYGPVPYQCFGEMMRRKLKARGTDVLEYLNQKLFKPLGIQYGYWRKDGNGNPHLPSGAWLTARDWAKYGELIRNRGGTILDPKLLARCFQGSNANQDYGMTWWLNSPSPTLRTRLLIRAFGSDDMSAASDIPNDLVFAAGSGGQRMYVIPSRRLVIVRQADDIAETRRDRSSYSFSDLKFLTLALSD